MDQSESVESSLSVIIVVVYYVCVNLHLQPTLGTKSANVVRFVSTQNFYNCSDQSEASQSNQHAPEVFRNKQPCCFNSDLCLINLAVDRRWQDLFPDPRV